MGYMLDRPPADLKRKAHAKWIEDLDIYTRLTKILYGRFEWQNLPFGLTSIQLERFLTNWGNLNFVAACEIDVAGVVMLPAMWGGPRNLYYLPNDYTVYGMGRSWNVKADDAVAVYNNSSQRSYYALVDNTCRKLADVWKTAALNVDQQKNPWMFGGNEDEIKSVQAAIASADQYKGYLLITQQLKELLSRGSALKVQPTLITAELMEHYDRIFNQFLTCIGIDNQPVYKRERVSMDESRSNDLLVQYNRDDDLRMRESAAQEINRRWNTNINVTWMGGQLFDGGNTVRAVSGYDK